jgi:hypothetical protein
MQSKAQREEVEMDSAEAASTLHEIERLTERTRRSAYARSIPFLVFGVLTLGSVPFTQIGEDGSDGYYWLVAGPVGCLLAWHLFTRRGERIGVIDRNAYIYGAIIAAMVAGALAVGWLGSEHAFSEVGTLFPIAAGLVAIAFVSRSALVGVAGLTIAAWGAAVMVADPAELSAWAYAGEGAALIGAGLVARAAEPR